MLVQMPRLPRFHSLAALAVLNVAVLVAAPACSSTRDLEASAPSSTIRDLGNDPLVDDEGLASGSQGAAEIQKIIDRLVASNDPCAILTQKDIRGLKIDATTLASSSARKTLAAGVVQVYDHVIRIVPDAGIKPSLEVQKSTFVQVLDVVERYTANPTSQEGNDEIRALVTGPDFVKAQTQVANWTNTNCG